MSPLFDYRILTVYLSQRPLETALSAIQLFLWPHLSPVCLAIRPHWPLLVPVSQPGSQNGSNQLARWAFWALLTVSFDRWLPIEFRAGIGRLQLSRSFTQLVFSTHTDSRTNAWKVCEAVKPAIPTSGNSWLMLVLVCSSGSGAGLPHLSVSSSTPPPSSSPLSIKVKSEPISPPRDGTHGSHSNLAPLQRPPSSTTGHLSPGHPLTPSTSSSPDPSGSSDYEGPIQKRIRVTADGWPA